MAIGLAGDSSIQTFLFSYACCVIGNMLPVPFIIFFAKMFLNWTAMQKPISPKFQKFFHLFPSKMEAGIKRFCVKFQKKCGPVFAKIINKAEEKASKVGKFELLGIYLFVAIPLPGTGAWMGTLVASILRLKFWPTIVSVLLGVMTSGIIMGILSFGLFSFI